MSHITLSSDAYGSFPVFDENGQVIRYGVGKPDTLLYMVKTMITKHQWSIEEAFSLVTRNVANVYKLGKKGGIKVGNDGDLLVFNQKWELEYVFANGKEMKTPDWVKKGMFEN